MRSGWVIRRRVGSGFLRGYAGLMYLFLYAPMLTIAVFSFEQARFPSLPLTGFTTDWYGAAFTDTKLLESLRNSLIVAPIVGLISISFGLLAAYELARRNFRGKGLVLLVIVAPLIVPLIVFGLALLLLLAAVGFETSLGGAIIAHSVFGIAVSTLLIYSRLLGFQHSLVEAAQDLGATPVRSFVEVTLPLTVPALAAAFLLSFTISFDEFIVAWFVIGFDVTLPVEIWTRLRYGIKPEINAIATVVLLTSLVLGILGQRLVVRTRR